MALTNLKRPKGQVIDTAGVSAVIVFNSDDAGIFKTAHGLSVGDYVYIESNVDSYNGFFYIPAIDADNFLISVNDSLSGVVAYIVDADITYYKSVYTHGWSCVHLPITYKISNNLYPVNSVDSARTIITLTNSNGFAQLGLSGSLGTFEDLSFVKISSAPNSDLDGIWQVMDKISTTSIILNLEYSSINGAAILGATIQLYYSNYNVVVRVYAGINSSHEWTAQKPYELAATLELIPDENNEVFFSINDILKAYVETKNNLLLGTLPNNIDAWTNFYISTAEQYDSSNGYTVGTTLSSFTSDQANFEGTAVNNMLAFKNQYSGYLSEYLMVNTSAKFLTLFTVTVLFSCGDDTPDCYYDISFLNSGLYNDLKMNQYLFKDSVVTLYEATDFTVGWTNEGAGVDWVFGDGSNSTMSVTLTNQTSKRARTNFNFIKGETYTFKTVTGSINGITSVKAYIGGVQEVNFGLTPIAATRRTFEFVADENYTYFELEATNTAFDKMSFADIPNPHQYGIIITGNENILINIFEYSDYSGVIRQEIEPHCSYDYTKIYLFVAPLLSTFPTNWVQRALGTRQWTIDSAPDVSLLVSTSSYLLYEPKTAPELNEYTFNYNISNTGASTSPTVQIGFLDSSFSFIVSEVIQLNGVQTVSGSFSITPDEYVSHVGIHAVNDDVASTTVVINSLSLDEQEITLSETKRIDIDCDCADQEIRLSWINNLDGFDYWKFTGQSEHAVDITGSIETKKNIFPQWPNSYGANADTIRKQTSRTSMVKKFITSQFLGKDIDDAIDKATALAYIKSSPLVQIVNSRSDRRTVTVDTDSFVIYTDGDKLVSISFNITYTDDIPSQKV